MEVTSEPPPKLVAALRELRRVLSSCDDGGEHPAEVATLVFMQDAQLTLGHDIVASGTTSASILAATFRHLVTDATLTGMVPHLLHRLFGPAPSSSSTRTSGSSSMPRGAAVITPPTQSILAARDTRRILTAGLILTSLIAPFVRAALDMCTTPEATAAAAAFMQALGQARPCGPLTAMMATARAAALSAGRGLPAAASDPTSFLGALCLDAASLGMLLLRHALSSEPASAALREDLLQSCLLRHTCEAVTHALAGQYGPIAQVLSPVPIIESVGRLALSFSLSALDDQAAAAAGTSATATWLAGARCTGLRTVAGEATFIRMILQALALFTSGPLTPAEEAGGYTPMAVTALMQAMCHWVDMVQCQGPSISCGLFAAAGVTAGDVQAMALASGGCCGAMTATAMCKAFSLLSPADQLLAYPAVAQHAGRLLDRLRGWYVSGGASDVFAQGNLEAYAARMDPGLCSAAAVVMFARPFSALPDLEQRSRFVLQQGLLSKTEALLRASVIVPLAAGQQPYYTQHRADDAVQQSIAARNACICAASLAAALIGGAPEGPAALAAYLSLLATTRKLMQHGTRAAAAASDHSPSGRHSQGLPPHLVPSGAVGQAVYLGPLQEVQSLSASVDPCYPAARLAVRCAALQLLPSLVQGLSVCWSPSAQEPRPLSAEEETSTRVRLELLGRLHLSGLYDVSIAAGVPALLLGLLQSQRVVGVGSTPHASPVIIAAAMQAVDLSARSDAWMREAGRLGLAGELAAWAQGGPRLLAAARSDTEALQVQQLLSLVNQLSSKCQASPDATFDFVMPTWDSCTLAAVAEAAAGGCVPFLGCWHRGCTNLAGGSEAALKLLKCSSCSLARYCSVACQKAAWTAGHRAACSSWKAKHAAPLIPV